MDRIEYIFDITRKFANGRKILLYGYNEKTRGIKNRLAGKGMKIDFFVDHSLYQNKKPGVYDSRILDGRSDEFYVIVGMPNRLDIICKLHSFGYFSQNDYVYLGDIEYCVLRDEDGYFEDNYGNQLIMNRKLRSQITLNGFNSRVVISDDCVVSPEFHLLITDECTVEIGNGTWLNGNFSIFDQSHFQCGERCIFAKGLLEMEAADIRIGNDLTTESGYVIRAYRKSSIIIGNDCMFSYNLNMRPNDGHVIFDVKTGKNINSTDELCESRNIIRIGDHVWVGMNACILYNTDISNGSIIGAMSLVKAKIPNNCIAAGNPARVIRTDIAWSRSNNNSVDIDECGDGFVKCTENKYSF